MVDPGTYIAYASQEIGAANSFLLQLGQLSGTLTPPVINAVFPSSPSSPPLALPTPPATTPIVWTAPGIPAPFTGTIAVDDILPDPFEEVAPTMVFGTAPTFTDVAPDAPGVNLSYDIPDLVVTLPVAPGLLSLNVPAFGGVNLPTFNLDIPQMSIDPPSIREYVPGAQYTSALLTQLKARLLDTLTNGGTGLSPDVEQAIWDRGREREAKSQRDSLDKLDAMETMGFALPPGVYLDSRLKIITETNYAEAGYSREVMIKQAELEQSNINHALDVSVQLEGQLISYTNQIEQRFFDSCRYATEAGVSIYNARVQAYNIFVDAFKARIAVYEAQVRGELAKVEVYKSQVEAEQAKADINRILVESYKAQIEAALSSVEVFKARIGAIQAKAEIEKMKVEIYGEQVKGYAAKVGAYTAGVEGFRASIQAEATKQDAFKSKVQVYSARVDAAAKLIDARVSVLQAGIAAKTAEFDGYKSAVSAESARVQSIATSNSSLADVYKAQVQGIASYNDVLTKQWSATIEQASRVAEIGVAAAKANAELYVTTRTLAVEAAKVGAQVSAQLGAAALNAINFSSSESNAINTSNSTVTSDSSTTNQSISQSTNYNYSG